VKATAVASASDSRLREIADFKSTAVIGTGAEELAIVCPFCCVMTCDGMRTRASDVEVLEVAQVLLRPSKE
jgi:hypothetical protein